MKLTLEFGFCSLVFKSRMLTNAHNSRHLRLQWKSARNEILWKISSHLFLVVTLSVSTKACIDKRIFHIAGRDLSYPNMNNEFVPRLQTISACLSLVNSFVLLGVGGAFLGFPRWVLSILLDYESTSTHVAVYNYERAADGFWNTEVAEQLFHHEDPSDSLASLIGGVLVAQGLACLVLLYPILSEILSSASVPQSTAPERKEYSLLALWNVRTSITIQLITGLIWIVIALYDDRSNEASVRAAKSNFVKHSRVPSDDFLGGARRRTTLGLLLIGFVILIIGCLSMMLTFWPVTDLNNSGSNRNSTASVVQEDLEVENQNLTEPLLVTDNAIQDGHDSGEPQGEVESDALPNDIGNGGPEDPMVQANSDLESNRDGGNEEDNHIDEPTSRIRGTKRLLAVAAPQVVYLYIGCITLLIRLPFSLSIPHFVSTTLGALADKEFDRARREIVWLFILGTIDAFLDFWCIFCKSANKPQMSFRILFSEANGI